MKNIGWGGFLATGVVIVGLSWFTGDFDITPPITFGEATLIPDSIAPGGRVMTYYKVNVVRDCSLDVSRQTTDAAEIVWPATTIHITKMAIGPGSINLAMVIPTDAADGLASFTNTVKYVCNPWQALFSPWQPMPLLSVDVDRG